LVLDLFYTPVYEEDGHIGGVVCTIADNSKRVDAERRLKASEAELRRIIDAVPIPISYLDRDYVYRFANHSYEDWLGILRGQDDRQNADGRAGRGAFRGAPPFSRTRLGRGNLIVGGCVPARDGTKRRCELRYIPHIEPDGSVPGTLIVAVDIEERAQREAALAISNRRFRTAVDAVHGVLWTVTPDGRMLDAAAGLGRADRAGFRNLSGPWLDRGGASGGSAETHRAWRRAVADKSMFVFEHRVRQRDGAWRNFAIRGLPILDEAGEVLEWVGVHTDITYQRAAEEQLRQLNEELEARVIAEIDERRRAEAKLLQAQKMETIGQLTGGVAHDFNNLLQIISGNLQLLGKDVAGNEGAAQRVASAMAGVSRGAKLASQLLAFARREALEPKVVNITRFVRGMEDLFRRALGEGVEVETIVSGGLWNSFIDPARIENALLNLVINARDAMNGQGRLTIELGNASLDDAYAREHDDVEPGQFVMLAVSDTGCGIPAGIIDRVFDPFFSTKKEGEGSGLGLSMVYGFVKQSGGHVKIYSEVGEGTTIRLYLPRARGSEEVEVAVAEGPVVGGSESILVVEDDPEVRATVVELLSELGYRVLKAVDAASALNVVESGVAIDLLFTDVVMPGTLKSPELARKARERVPQIAVLFTSGYTEDSIVHGGKLDAGVELISKPYTREALARKVRHVLGNQKQRAERPDAAPSTRPADEPSAYRAAILLVEDDHFIRSTASDMLKDAGFAVIDAADAEHAMIALQTMPIDCLVTDVNLPGLVRAGFRGPGAGAAAGAGGGVRDRRCAGGWPREERGDAAQTLPA
jgi:signal transduction histidine kinase/CheY-like chemotaxis protein